MAVTDGIDFWLQAGRVRSLGLLDLIWAIPEVARASQLSVTSGLAVNIDDLGIGKLLVLFHRWIEKQV